MNKKLVLRKALSPVWVMNKWYDNLGQDGFISFIGVAIPVGMLTMWIMPAIVWFPLGVGLFASRWYWRNVINK